MCQARDFGAKDAVPAASKQEATLSKRKCDPSAIKSAINAAINAGALSPRTAKSVPAQWVQFIDKDTPTIPLWKRRPRARQGSYGFEEEEDDV